jgi:hypothetical protein
MGETYGGDRPQRGFMWGMGETYGGDRPQRGFIRRLLKGYRILYYIINCNKEY